MAHYEGDVQLCVFLPYIPGTSLQEWVLAPASLKDDVCGLIISEHVEKLVCELGSPQLDGQSSFESLEVTNERVAPDYTGRKSSMLCSASCKGSTARLADVDVELEQVPAILMNDEGSIHCGEEMVKPG